MTLETLPSLFRWLGAKRRLAVQIAQEVPGDRPYYEPMAGTAAIWAQTHVKGRPVFLGEQNRHIVNLYLEIRSGAWRRWHDTLVDISEWYSKQEPEHQEAFFRAKRDQFNAGDQGALNFLVLIALVFNGIWRENKSGGMNAPSGHRKTLSYPSSQTLGRWEVALQDADIGHCSVLTWKPPKTPGTIYLDPPYQGTFDAYCAEGFKDADQVKLLELGRQWARGGHRIVYSNSMAARDRVAGYWPEATLKTLVTKYLVAAKGEDRTPVTELLAILDLTKP